MGARLLVRNGPNSAAARPCGHAGAALEKRRSSGPQAGPCVASVVADHQSCSPNTSRAFSSRRSMARSGVAFARAGSRSSCRTSPSSPSAQLRSSRRRMTTATRCRPPPGSIPGPTDEASEPLRWNAHRVVHQPFSRTRTRCTLPRRGHPLSRRHRAPAQMGHQPLCPRHIRHRRNRGSPSGIHRLKLAESIAPNQRPSSGSTQASPGPLDGGQDSRGQSTRSRMM